MLSWLICLLVGYGMFSSLDAQYVASGKSTPRESFYILVITPAGMAVLLLAALIIFNLPHGLGKLFYRCLGYSCTSALLVSATRRRDVGAPGGIGFGITGPSGPCLVDSWAAAEQATEDAVLNFECDWVRGSRVALPTQHDYRHLSPIPCSPDAAMAAASRQALRV